jgi:hypothetical protein
MLRLQSELGDLVDRPGRMLEAKHRKPKGRGRLSPHSPDDALS